MPYVTIPKDLTKVKTKVLFNLTWRQLVCFGTGIVVGLPLFFLLKAPLGNSLASLVMILAMVPAFLFAVYEKNGQPLEMIGRNMIRATFLRPKRRLYQTQNYYAALERQMILNKEVQRIVQTKKTVPRRKKGYTGRYLKSETDSR